MLRFLPFLLCLVSPCAHALDIQVASSTNSLFTAPNYTCDGINDNVEIQLALDRIKSAGGGTVFLSNGIFNVRTTLNVYEKTELIGAGIDTTVLRLINNAPMFAKAGFVRCLTQNFISVKHLTLDGNRANQSRNATINYGRFGLYTEACNNTIFDNLRVKNWYGYGIDPHGIGGTSVPSEYITITNNIVHDNGWDGITVDKCENSIVAYNNVYNNGRHGINICTGSKQVSTHDNIVTNNGWSFNGRPNGCGIMIQNNQNYTTRNIDIMSNSIRSSQKAGICMSDVFFIKINNNIIQNTTTCLRTKNIASLASNSIDVDINVCDSTRALHSETSYSGNIPTFLATISPKEEYIVVSQSSSMTGDFKCDGLNDEVEIRKAIMYVAFYGGVVTLSDGVFSISNNIELLSNIILRGQGRDITSIRLVNNAPIFKYSGLIRGFDVQNITIKDLAIDGNKDFQVQNNTYNYGKYGFYCEVCRNISFDNIIARNSWGYGIDPHGAPGEAWYSDGFQITNSIVENNGWDGVTIDKTINVLITNNIIRNNGRHGVNIVTGSKTVDTNNNNISNNGFFYYTGSRGCGIMIQNNEMYGTRDIITQYNNINNSSNSGICVNDVDYNFITANNITGLSSCIKITNSDFVTLNGNICNPSIRKVSITGTYSNATYVLVNQSNIVYR